MTELPGVNDGQALAAIGQRILAWYDRNRRDLPWRRTQDPYAIWVAEIMLQQTRADTVAAYYDRFLARFPTLQSLAAAALDDVLKAWAGLGYYARARNLHAAARWVVNNLAGELPHAPEDLLILPGVGQYTAAAIASIAFRHEAVALDGNLNRVLCRIFGIDDDPGRPKTRHLLEKLALGMCPPGRAGDLNQALMDLGATVCTPTTPRCLICPLINLCQAQVRGIQNALPIRATRTNHPHRDVTAGVIWDQAGHLLITQRPLDGMLGGLWEFPGGKCLPGENLPDCLRREISEELAIEIEVGDQLCAIDHDFTHFHMMLYVFNCRWLGGQPQCLGCLALHWVRLDELSDFAFPVADQKIIAFLRNQNSLSG